MLVFVTQELNARIKIKTSTMTCCFPSDLVFHEPETSAAESSDEPEVYEQKINDFK